MRGDSDDEHGPTSAPASRQMSRAGSTASPRRGRSELGIWSCLGTAQAADDAGFGGVGGFFRPVSCGQHHT